MRHLKEYLIESAKKYDFRIKIAGEVSSAQEDLMKTLLEKYKINTFKKVGKTPIQQLPLDFPKVNHAEVNIFEVVLDYPSTPQELTEYISAKLSIPHENLVVRRQFEPTEEYQQPVEQRKEALLTDPDYKEAKNHKFEDYYGDNYNAKFVKELVGQLQDQRRQRGEKIPKATSTG